MYPQSSMTNSALNTRTIIAVALVVHALFGGPLFAQTIDFQWARSASGTDLDIGQKVASDGSGNVFVTGYFRSDTISFGSIDLTKETGSSSSSAIFLAKYDASGNVVWARSAGGNEEDIVNDVATDADGNVLITGGFQSDSIAFGSTTLHNAVTGASEDVFVVKYDPDGNVLWARSGGGTGGTPRDVGNAIAVDASGNVYACGYFRSQNMAFGTATLTGVGQADAFIVKYDANGDVLWARSEAGAGGDFFTALDVDAGGNIYVAGHYYSNSITIGDTTLTNTNNNYELFMAKYDTDGNPLWARGASGNGNDESIGLATDGSGNVIVTGLFEAFPLTFGSATLPNGGSRDIFIVKYSTLGDFLWATSAGGTYAEESGAIATDASGSVYLTGLFGSSISFGSIAINGTLSSNVFIAKYDANGDALWAIGAGGIDDEQGNGIAVAGADNVYVTGSFDSSSLPCGPDTLSNSGPDDVFIAKLGLVTTGVEENRFPDGIRISPNPSYGLTTVRSNFPLNNATFTIVDDFGRTVQVIRNVNGSEIPIPLGDLPIGTYLLQIKQGDKWVAMEKIILLR